MTRFEELLHVLNQSQVEYLVIGGVAGTLHGSSMATYDLDIVYRRSKENIQRLVSALEPLEPYLRGVPPGLPFVWDVKTVERGLNFTLVTTLGDLDILGEVAGAGTYDNLASTSLEAEIGSANVPFIDLTSLINAKRAAGRPKDLEAIAILEALREERGERE
jgi:hypothetical protein